MLSPDAVKVDGREVEDFLDFLFQFARQINFYKKDPEERSGDWTNFFLRSIPVQIALISKFDVEAVDGRLLDISDAIDDSLAFESLDLLLDLGFDMAEQLEQWLKGLQQDESGLRKSIRNLIDTNLRFAIKRLIGHANAAGRWGYQRPKNTQNLIDYWGFNSPMEVFAVDRTLLQLKGSRKKQVLAAKAILEELVLVFIKGVAEIVRIANEPGRVEQSLESTKAHEPHLGLMYAFLRLFKQVQNELNLLSRAHLDFFYRQVLRLEELEVIADKAHLVFELAKQVDTHKLPAGTRFKAGKDENGADLFYRLEEEIILDKTQVTDLKTLFIDQAESTEGSLLIKDIYMAPVANSADGKGEAFQEENPTWETLGSKQSKFFDEESGGKADHPYACLGFILASPVLLLREGKRTIGIKITAENEWPAGMTPTDFKLYFSGEEGWFEPLGAVTLDCAGCGPGAANNDPKVLCMSVTLESTEPAILFPGADLLEADYGLTQPMVKLVLNHEQARFQNGDETYSRYMYLRDVKVAGIDIQVKVCGLRNLVVQNDSSVLDINKPFMPFGPVPVANNSNFYLGSEEVFSKNWSEFDVNIQWKDLPPAGNGDRFAKHYEAYEPGTIPSTSDFKVDVSLLNEKNWITNTSNPESLFQEGRGKLCEDEAFTHFFHFDRTDFGSVKPCEAFTPEGYTVDSQCGYLKFKLGDQDFLHAEYPKVLAKQLMALGKSPDIVVGAVYDTASGVPQVFKFDLIEDAIAKIRSTEDKTDEVERKTDTAKRYVDRGVTGTSLSNAVNDAESSADEAENLANEARTAANAILNNSLEVILPNEPYTPQIEALSMDYCAEDSWGESASTSSDVSFVHLYPYDGTYLHQQEDQETSPAILPPFFDEGTLFIGLNGLTPGGTLNLLFQMEETTADPEMDKAVICWHYLKDNEWRLLKPDFHLLADETQGLIQSGVINFSIPGDISNKQTTIMPSALHWLRATAHLRSGAVAETKAVHTQAARVKFVPEADNDLQRPGEALEAGTIAKPARNIAALKSVNQLYPGFGGRAKEVPDTYYTRVSERLRHKGRAITLYDYERLILQEFPDIFKVKCITHTMGRRGQKLRDYELSPGFVTIVVVPDLRKAQFPNPFEPKVTFSTQTAVKHFLKKRLSPFVRLQVLNPKYEEVALSGEIKFIQGKSTAFYLEQLKNHVRYFLAPWANPEEQEEISFGGKIFKSSILNFIEKRSYVDYVVNFEMYREENNESENTNEPVDEIAASSARSILIGGTFSFEALEQESCTETGARIPGAGIGYSTIKN